MISLWSPAPTQTSHNSRRNRMDKLGPRQTAIFELVSKYSKFPIDKEHFKTKTRGKETVLEFYYKAASESEFDVRAEFFENSFTLYCDGWHDDFLAEEDPIQNAEKALEILKSIFKGKVRLLIKTAGRLPYKWLIILEEGIDWNVMGLTGLIFYNYFGKRKVVKKVNRIIS